MKFFIDCKDKEEAKIVYRRLVKCFHPDKGGSNELMIELQKQYDNFVTHPQDNGFGNSIKGGQYFNFHNMGRYHIPFDHPIHDQMRKLNDENINLTNTIRVYQKNLEAINRDHEHLLRIMRKENSEKTNEIDHLNILLEQTKKDFNDLRKSQPATLWQYLWSKV